MSRFFTDTEINYFRYWQSQTGMFISGSTALQFFDRTFYADSDLDIYVEHRYCKPIALWLKSIGYSFQPRKTYQSKTLDIALDESLSDSINTNNLSQGIFESTSMGYFGRGVSNVYNFHKVNPDRKIQLITSYYAPLEIVLNFHSSKSILFSSFFLIYIIILACVMNLITHERAYSLYPHATFEERRSLVISTEGSRQETARKKYAERGWSMVQTGQDEDIRNARSDFTQSRRYIGDSRCWTLPVIPELDRDLREDFITTNTWELKYIPVQVAEPEYEALENPPANPDINLKLDGRVEPMLSFMILRMENLRFSYLVVDKSVQDFLHPALSQSSEGGRYELQLSLFLTLMEHSRTLVDMIRILKNYFSGVASDKSADNRSAAKHSLREIEGSFRMPSAANQTVIFIL